MQDKNSEEYLASIIVPCYNAEKYIGQAIESVLNQTHRNFELIIVNDGSTDHSENIIRKYQQSDNRVQYFSQENKGVAAARNLGIRQSSGQIIAFLDSDDAWEPENLETKVKVLAANPSTHWVYSDMYLGDELLNKTDLLEGGSDSDLLNSLLSRKGEAIHAPSGVVLKRECLSLYHLEFDGNATPSEDWDFCIQITAKKFNGKRIPIPLWTYRVLPNSLSRNLGKLEKGNLLVLEKASQAKLFRSFWFRQKCYSNTFLILAGSWWVDGKNIPKGLYYILKSVLSYPPNIVKLLTKIRYNNIYQAKSIPIAGTPSFLQKAIPFRQGKHPAKKSITVFLFHRVNTFEDPLWNPIRPEYFEQIISYLQKNFEPAPLTDYLLEKYLPQTEKPLCAIGFDDGYRDFIDFAMPALEQYQFPASMYVVTDCIDQNLPPWTYILNHLFLQTSKLSLDINTGTFPGHLRSTKWNNRSERIAYARSLNPFLKSLPNSRRVNIYNLILQQFSDVSLPRGLMMSWEDIRYIQAKGYEIGSHSVGHPVLSKDLSHQELMHELNASALAIEKNTGVFPLTISYPFGAYNNEVKKAASEAGYKIGVTVNSTPYDSRRHDLLEVPRIELFDEPFLKTRLRINDIMPKIKKILFTN